MDFCLCPPLDAVQLKPVANLPQMDHSSVKCVYICLVFIRLNFTSVGLFTFCNWLILSYVSGLLQCCCGIYRTGIQGIWNGKLHFYTHRQRVKWNFMYNLTYGWLYLILHGECNEVIEKHTGSFRFEIVDIVYLFWTVFRQLPLLCDYIPEHLHINYRKVLRA